MITGIPKNEKIWVRRITEKGEVFYTTSKEIRDNYFLYKIENNLDMTNTPLKSNCGFRSYGEAYEVLLYERIDIDRYWLAAELIFGKDQLEKWKSKNDRSKVQEAVYKNLRAVKLGKSKSPVELELKYIG